MILSKYNTTCIDAVILGESLSWKEAYMTIRSSSTWGKYARITRTPTYGLDGCFMLMKLNQLLISFLTMDD